MRDEGLGAPVDVAAEGLAGCGVGGREGVVDEGRTHGSGGFDGLGDEAGAEGEGGFVADAGGAFGEEDDGEAVAEALGHAFGGLGGGATLAAGDVDGSGHHGHPAEDGGVAELGLGDEDAGTHGGVEEDVSVGEVVGDDGAGGGDRADGVVGDVHGAEDAGAEGAEPGGAGGAGLRARDDELGAGVGEVGDDFCGAVELVEQGQVGEPRWW